MDKFKKIDNSKLSLEEFDELWKLQDELDRKIMTKKEYERDFADGKYDEYVAESKKERYEIEKRIEELESRELGR